MADTRTRRTKPRPARVYEDDDDDTESINTAYYRQSEEESSARRTRTKPATTGNPLVRADALVPRMIFGGSPSNPYIPPQDYLSYLARGRFEADHRRKLWAVECNNHGYTQTCDAIEGWQLRMSNNEPSKEAKRLMRTLLPPTTDEPQFHKEVFSGVQCSFDKVEGEVPFIDIPIDFELGDYAGILIEKDVSHTSTYKASQLAAIHVTAPKGAAPTERRLAFINNPVKIHTKEGVFIEEAVAIIDAALPRENVVVKRKLTDRTESMVVPSLYTMFLGSEIEGSYLKVDVRGYPLRFQNAIIVAMVEYPHIYHPASIPWAQIFDRVEDAWLALAEQAKGDGENEPSADAVSLVALISDNSQPESPSTDALYYKNLLAACGYPGARVTQQNIDSIKVILQRISEEIYSTVIAPALANLVTDELLSRYMTSTVGTIKTHYLKIPLFTASHLFEAHLKRIQRTARQIHPSYDNFYRIQRVDGEKIKACEAYVAINFRAVVEPRKAEDAEAEMSLAVATAYKQSGSGSVWGVPPFL